MAVAGTVVDSRAHHPGTSGVGHPPRLRRPSRRAALVLCLALSPLLLAGRPVAAGVSQPRPDPRLSRAAAWAAQRVDGPHLWIADGDTLCGQFVEHAYGVSGVYATAYDMYRALGKSRPRTQHTLAGLGDAPPGALVFFAPTARNGGSGHVGIYIGGGEFVGVGTGGHVRRHGVRWYNDAIAPYLGWAYPPAGWPGVG